MLNFDRLDRDKSYYWTLHSRRKLIRYQLSPNLIKRIIRFPDRKEEGIADGTIAVMKDKTAKKSPKEIWVMYQNKGRRKRIISTWIYPGVSPKGKEIFVPDDVWEELVFLSKK